MRRCLILLALLSSLAVAQNAQPNPFDAVVQQKFASGGTVRLHLDSGAYTIKPTDSDAIVVTYSTEWKGSNTRDVNVEVRPKALNADIYVRNTPHNFRATIEIPRRSNLWARMTAGELDIGNVEGDKNIEMWAGELEIAIPHPEDYGHRDASVLAGSLEASAFNISKGGLFRSFHEQGPGKYRLHAHVTTGEIAVR
jgi:hypothetical protein